MRYIGPSVNRSCRTTVDNTVIPEDCPEDKGRCNDCPRFGRLRSSGESVVCLDDPNVRSGSIWGDR